MFCRTITVGLSLISASFAFAGGEVVFPSGTYQCETFTLNIKMDQTSDGTPVYQIHETLSPSVLPNEILISKDVVLGVESKADHNTLFFSRQLEEGLELDFAYQLQRNERTADIKIIRKVSFFDTVLSENTCMFVQPISQKRQRTETPKELDLLVTPDNLIPNTPTPLTPAAAQELDSSDFLNNLLQDIVGSDSPAPVVDTPTPLDPPAAVFRVPEPRQPTQLASRKKKSAAAGPTAPAALQKPVAICIVAKPAAKPAAARPSRQIEVYPGGSALVDGKYIPGWLRVAPSEHSTWRERLDSSLCFEEGNFQVVRPHSQKLLSYAKTLQKCLPADSPHLASPEFVYCAALSAARRICPGECFCAAQTLQEKGACGESQCRSFVVYLGFPEFLLFPLGNELLRQTFGADHLPSIKSAFDKYKAKYCQPK